MYPPLGSEDTKMREPDASSTGPSEMTITFPLPLLPASPRSCAPVCTVTEVAPETRSDPVPSPPVARIDLSFGTTRSRPLSWMVAGEAQTRLAARVHGPDGAVQLGVHAAPATRSVPSASRSEAAAMRARSIPGLGRSGGTGARNRRVLGHEATVGFEARGPAERHAVAPVAQHEAHVDRVRVSRQEADVERVADDL